VFLEFEVPWNGLVSTAGAKVLSVLKVYGVGCHMKIVLISAIFFAGVYCGLYVDPGEELGRMVEQLQVLINGEPEW